MRSIYDRARTEANYPATYFLSMLAEHGSLATARRLLHAPTVSDGFAALWHREQPSAGFEPAVDPLSHWPGEDRQALALDELRGRHDHARVHRAGRHEEAAGEDRHLMEKFPASAERHPTLMVDVVDRPGLERVDTGGGRSVEAMADAVPAAAGARNAVGRLFTGWWVGRRGGTAEAVLRR